MILFMFIMMMVFLIKVSMVIAYLEQVIFWSAGIVGVRTVPEENKC